MSNTRRSALLMLGLAPWATRAAAASGNQQLPLVFPRDRGSHPQSRTEWWYITGHAHGGPSGSDADLGFQITFFRSRPDNTQTLKSRFAAHQLLFAHAAITDIPAKRFWHDQRIARQGFGLAQASETDTDIRLHDWSLVYRDGVYLGRIQSGDFSLQLAFRPTQPVLLQGDKGLSRKGPDAGQTSHYYSEPQLAFEGQVTLRGRQWRVRGQGGNSGRTGLVPGSGAAWLDHEWSDQLLHPLAVGWDWVGINLFDGGALTAFQVRDAVGAALWDGGSMRSPAVAGAHTLRTFARGEVNLRAVRSWKSALTQATYPVQWTLQTPTDTYSVRALLDNQELDSRSSTGAVYWEGLCDVFDSRQRHVGRGYLEMTGYAKPLVL